MGLLSDEDVRALHAKYAPSQEAFDLVHSHCETVWRIAEQLLQRRPLDVDVELIRVGCLLHDIGVYRLYDADGRFDHAGYIRHGILGHEILADEGLPEAVCRFCSHHTGVGLTREDVRRQGLPLPDADYLAETVEEELVMYADKFHSKTDPPRFVPADEFTRHVRRFGDDKVTAFEAMCGRFGLPDLAALGSGTAPG
ncbi:HD domain-containing protein [Actinomadura sp. WMMB 499]|uniref:HD domain-containing protein n=1 Tax=Actinomadura sp. WMMB 499 TaxID=1219491 RepID=UPI001249454E|nr:HD domain-containing protein [Actinomadura sp. WMMB 499]QFG25189.1 HD domain-containing protein [Actinomadura sp. WMMB 499]